MSTRTVQQLFDLTGRTALVTGGSRGLGLQMAHALGEAGARVLISSRKADDLAEAVATLKAAGIDACWVAADASKPEDITRLANEAMAQLGGLLLSQKLEHTGKIAVLLSLDRVKLRHPVTPGDQVLLEAETIRASSRTASIRGMASVGGKLAAEANIRFMMVDAEQA